MKTKELVALLMQVNQEAEVVTIVEELGGSVPILHVMYEPDVHFVDDTNGTVSLILE